MAVIDGYETHPAADVFPLLEGAEVRRTVTSLSLVGAPDQVWWDLARAVLDREVVPPCGLNVSQRALLAAMMIELIESRREGARGGVVVYFVRDRQSDLIKIGSSCNERKRLRSLQTAHGGQLWLMATCPGGRAREYQLHCRFAASRVRGEWFRASPDLLAFIEQLGTPEGVIESQAFFSNIGAQQCFDFTGVA